MKNNLPSPTLKKAKKLLVHAYHLYERKKDKLEPIERKTFETHLKALQSSIMERQKAKAKKETKAVKALLEKLFPRTSFQKTCSFVCALVVALGLALLIRQMIFELYEIPTGSMRPTLKEKDRLVVSKTTFGINIPFSLNQLYFDPSLVERSGIVVFSGEGMDIRDVDTKYFYVLPGKKQYVKRMIGKPGDTLYFYGGLIYGVDHQGNDISAELQPKRLNQIEHIPFIQFEGKALTPSQPSRGIYTPVVLYQMNEPVAKLYTNRYGAAEGKTLPILVDANKVSPAPKYYDELWGFMNYGMARILTCQELSQYTNESLHDFSSDTLFMQIQHHPNLEDIEVKRDIRGRMRPQLGLNTSVIPLTKENINALFDNLYTARFIVKNGQAYRYGLPKSALQSPFLPKLAGVPDGTYEFYHGTAYKISWEGITFALDQDHPLYVRSKERLQLFYNLGIEFDTRIIPPHSFPSSFPSRYVYFRDGALYAMGSPIFFPSDTNLKWFEQREVAKQNNASSKYPYVPFIDHGSPLLEDGSLDTDKILQYGVSVPEKMYLVLGDNHAMSADSRDFGFVPEKNLKGAPDWIFWPPGPRFGTPNQPAYPFMNYPRGVMWTIIGICIAGYVVIHRKRNTLPLL